MEPPEPFIDRVVGPMTEELFTEGKDEFLATAAKHGLTYVPYNLEFGSPLWYRCGRHLTGALEAINWMNQFQPEKEVLVEWPTYLDLQANDCGYYLHDPKTAAKELVFEI